MTAPKNTVTFKIAGKAWDAFVDLIGLGSPLPPAPPPSQSPRFTLELEVCPTIGQLAGEVIKALTPWEQRPAPPTVLAFCKGLCNCVSAGEHLDEVEGTNPTTGNPTLRFVPSAKYRDMVDDLVIIAKRELDARP